MQRRGALVLCDSNNDINPPILVLVTTMGDVLIACDRSPSGIATACKNSLIVQQKWQTLLVDPLNNQMSLYIFRQQFMFGVV